jgi:hypothetical protein
MLLASKQFINSYFLDLMPLAFQNNMLVWVKDLSVIRNTEGVGKEITEYDLEGAVIWVLHELQEHDWDCFRRYWNEKFGQKAPTQ